MGEETVKWTTLMALYELYHDLKLLPPLSFDTAVNQLIELVRENAASVAVHSGSRATR